MVNEKIHQANEKSKFLGKAIVRDAESWWGYSDSDSGLLIDSGSNSDSASDTKYK